MNKMPMKKPLYFSLLLFLTYSCKKQANTSSPPSPFSYFKDTNSNKPTGLEPSSSTDLEYVPFVEDVDTFLIPAFGRISSPPTWTLDVPPPGTQLYNSCVGWTIGHGILGFHYKFIASHPDYSSLDRIFSAAYIWNQLNDNIDKGISLANALRLVKQEGCCKWPYMPANVNSYTVQPSAEARANASNYKLSEFMRFKTADINLLKYYISKNNPIPFGVTMDVGFFTGKEPNSFEKKQDGRLIWKQYTGVALGNHAMLLCGYDDNINAFKVLNSWGPDWGNQGYIWIDYNFFKKAIVRDALNKPEIYLAITRKLGTVSDIDGNIYRTVKIGNQEWMIDNLKSTHFRNGDSISNITDASHWSTLGTSAYCNYGNDGNNSTIYGCLYNWYAVNDSRKLAPLGWHIPSDKEWDILENYLGGVNLAGGKMKETGIRNWLTPNQGATNSSGFTGLPGGTRGIYGNFASINTNGNWWTSTIWPSFGAYYRGLTYGGEDIIVWHHSEKSGMSIRCIKD